MRENAPRAPFDQGLFLTHLNRGKALYEDRQYTEAERELEEAYLLRPRDQGVLNLLGLVYFRQEKLEKAEEVYRKLAAESPDAPTLYYNLGLIHFKLARLEEAESSFLKALELSRESPKINFYLGSVYERMQRYPDAIYQYRQAGAHLMVRRVEDKMAADASARPKAKRKDDTAEFKTGEIRAAIGRQPTDDTLPPTRVQPVSPTVMAEHAPGRMTSDTARLLVAPRPESVAETAGPGHDEAVPTPPGPRAGRRVPEVVNFPEPAGSAPRPGVHAGQRRETLRILENNLLEVDFSGKVFIKQGTIYSYGGNLTFWVKERRPGGQPALVIITGTGKVILSDKDREITFMTVEQQVVFVEPNHLLACEASLTPRYLRLEGTSAVEFLAVEGQGMVALSVASRPLALLVTPELPVSVPASSIIGWTGSIRPTVVEDRQIYEIMMPPGSQRGPLVRLEGSGRLLVEHSL